MNVALVGYRGSGKSTLFHWLTGHPPDPAAGRRAQSAMAPLRDPRLEALAALYRPKKTTAASLEIVDTPSLDRSHQGSAARLALIREADCLVQVIDAFQNDDPAADLANFDDDLLLADLDLVARRVERLREAVKKPRPEREKLAEELELLEPLQQALEAGRALREAGLTDAQRRVIRSFQLLTEKPRFVLFNTAEDETQPERLLELAPAGTPAAALSASLQLELAAMPADERASFCRELGVAAQDRDALLRRLLQAAGRRLFFTVGPKEVRSWMIPAGATAVEAAGQIHTDLARGFIRAEVMRAEDLIRLESEREVKAAGLLRHEPKSYVVQDGDVLLIRHS